MAQYTYRGIDRDGKRVDGRIDAGSEGDVRMQLRQMGVRPTKINTGRLVDKDLGELFGPSGKMNLAQLIVFTRQLQALVSSGIPIVQGLEILEEQFDDKGPKVVLAKMRERVSSGSFLWESMAQFPQAFPKMFISLIRAGEASGSIDTMLKRLSRYLEDEDRLRKLIKGAMIYPIGVVSVGIGVITLMLVFVIPKFEEMLKQNGQELPAPTRFVINASHFLADNAIVIVITTIVTAVVLTRFFKTPAGRAILDRFVYRLPLFGPLMQKAGTAKFSRTMSTLLSSGVNLIDGVDICRATIGNAVLEDAVGTIRAEVEAGKTLGSVIGRLGVFPKMACQMIAVGEGTGSLDKMLEKVADFYEEEVENTVGAMTKLIEPVIIVVLGGAVGGMMVAMYLPLFKAAGSS